jgi:hypothetical protein
MKHLKILGLTVVAAVAMMALGGAGTASATALYSGASKLAAGTEIVASLSGTATLTTTEGTVFQTCSDGQIKGNTTNAGGPAETVKIAVEKTGFIWKQCTEPTSTLAGGTLEMHWTSEINGTVTGSGFEVTINTTIFGSCIFTLPPGTTLGTFTGAPFKVKNSKGEEEEVRDAVIHINTTIVRKSGLCPASERWVGSYNITTPTPLHTTAS